jgi:hypothetical protein
MRYVAAGVMQGAGVVRRANLLALLATAAGLEGHVLPLVRCTWMPREPAFSIELGGRPVIRAEPIGRWLGGWCDGAPGRCGQGWPVASWRAISSISFCSPRIGRTMTVKLTSFPSLPQRKMSTPWT